MPSQNLISPQPKDSDGLDKAVKVVGIFIALVGCLITILSYLRGCASKPAENMDARQTQELMGTWFRSQLQTVNGQDVYELERVDNIGTKTTTTIYIWPGIDRNFEGRFLCVSSVEGEWSVHDNVWSVQRANTFSEPLMYARDGGPVDPRWIESGYSCGRMPFDAQVQLKIESLSASEARVVYLIADQSGKQIEATYTRANPYPGFLRRKWYWLTHLFD
jgi:hypothetical protein